MSFGLLAVLLGAAIAIAAIAVVVTRGVDHDDGPSSAPVAPNTAATLGPLMPPLPLVSGVANAGPTPALPVGPTPGPAVTPHPAPAPHPPGKDAGTAPAPTSPTPGVPPFLPFPFPSVLPSAFPMPSGFPSIPIPVIPGFPQLPGMPGASPTGPTPAPSSSKK